MSFQMHCLKDKTKLSFECSLRLGFTSIVNTRCTTRNCKQCLRRNSIFSSNLLFSAPPPPFVSFFLLGSWRAENDVCAMWAAGEDGGSVARFHVAHSLAHSFAARAITDCACLPPCSRFNCIASGKKLGANSLAAFAPLSPLKLSAQPCLTPHICDWAYSTAIKTSGQNPTNSQPRYHQCPPYQMGLIKCLNVWGIRASLFQPLDHFSILFWHGILANALGFSTAHTQYMQTL